MDRLCERPGCSERASVAYGMRAEDLVFWLDSLDVPGDGGGVLCRRHANSMVVPRGWTLDDLRDPDLHLFRPPEPLPPPIRATRRAPRHERAAAEQLELRTVDSDVRVAAPDDESDVSVADAPTTITTESIGPWTPSFDEADDLDGLLVARSPLLARAFRTAEQRTDG